MRRPRSLSRFSEGDEGLAPQVCQCRRNGAAPDLLANYGLFDALPAPQGYRVGIVAHLESGSDGRPLHAVQIDIVEARERSREDDGGPV